MFLRSFEKNLISSEPYWDIPPTGKSFPNVQVETWALFSCWSSVNVPLIFSCATDDLPHWQPTMILFYWVWLSLDRSIETTHIQEHISSSSNSSTLYTTTVGSFCTYSLWQGRKSGSSYLLWPSETISPHLTLPDLIWSDLIWSGLEMNEFSVSNYWFVYYTILRLYTRLRMSGLSLGVENERAHAGRDGQICLARPNFQARACTGKF